MGNNGRSGKRRPHKNSHAKRKLFAKIGDRDGWRCQICGEPVMKLRIQNHPESPSLDHIIPVCEGGTYEQHNLRLTHLKCNNQDGVRHDPEFPKEKLDVYLKRYSGRGEGDSESPPQQKP